MRLGFLFAAMCVAAGFIASPTLADTYVRGYQRQDGTYVQPHYRSSPNGTTLDNWSTRGNINPHTGAVGTRDPYPTYQAPTYQAPTYGNGAYGTRQGTAGSRGNGLNSIWGDDSDE